MDDWKLLTPLTQGGSFALLVFIVVWLTTWLPKRWAQWDLDRSADRKAQTDVAAIHQSTISQITSVHTQNVNDLVKAFKEETKYEREVCERRHAENIARHEITEDTLRRIHDDVKLISTIIPFSVTTNHPKKSVNPSITKEQS